MNERLHGCLGRIGPESGFLPDPVGALAGNRALRQLVAQLDFEFRAVQPAFPPSLGDEELPPLLAQPIRDFVGHEGWRREDELQAVDPRQLGFQGLKRVDGKAGGRDAKPGVASKLALEVISEPVGNVVDQVHWGNAFCPSSGLVGFASMRAIPFFFDVTNPSILAQRMRPAAWYAVALWRRAGHRRQSLGLGDG
ncbi:MAG: hypothetical protein ACXIUM_00470 [Wenzhouxiangella sp.]